MSGPLAAYLALLHTCGPEAKFKAEPPTRLETDIFTLWAATGPDLKAVLKRTASASSVPSLARATRWRLDMGNDVRFSLKSTCTVLNRTSAKGQKRTLKRERPPRGGLSQFLSVLD